MTERRKEGYVVCHGQTGVWIEPCGNSCRNYDCIEHGCCNSQTFADACDSAIQMAKQRVDAWEKVKAVGADAYFNYETFAD